MSNNAGKARRREAPLPKETIKVVALARVSTEKQLNLSPAVQSAADGDVSEWVREILLKHTGGE